MKKTYKALSILLAIILIAGAVCAAPLTAYAEGEDYDPVFVSGSCGVGENSDVEYYCFKDNSMAIFGTGAIMDYSTKVSSGSTISTAPWYGDDFGIISNTLFITKIAVEYGVTRIGDYSFYIPDNYPYKFYVQLKNIDIANTVTSIGKYAFYNQQIQQVKLPPTVTHIGANAFQKCQLNAENGITYYGDPAHLTWDSEGDVDSEFPNGMKVHILDTFTADQVKEFNSRFAYKHITFVNDAANSYASETETLDRNIAAYYGSVNSGVFGGAAPFIIVGRFDGKKKSVTHGSNGFASCVYYNNQYYILTDNATGALNKANCNSTSGKIESYDTPALSDLNLKISHEYIGSNTVKMIYTLKNNTGSDLTGIKLGGTGDIKIGADDTAAIEPLCEENTTNQIGFYMKSTKDYDKSGDNYATLGFIGKVDGYTENAKFFYGEVSATMNTTAAGSKTIVLIPERIFNKNNGSTGTSHETGTFNENKDSGMSFYWDNITLPANEEKKFAVLFSVYGTNSTDQGKSMITDLTADFYEVTWEDPDTHTLVKQVVKNGEVPVYPGATPTKPRDIHNNEYTFSHWTPEISAVNGANKTYQAVFTQTPHRLFTGHSLTLRGDIGVNFFVDVTEEQVRNGVTIKFEWYDQHSEYTLHPSDYVPERGYYRARCNVCAAEMTDNIHATAYFGTTLYTDETDDYSVKQYAAEILNPTEGGAIAQYRDSHQDQYNNLVNLVKAMLDYGTKAQVLFNHNNTAEQYANKDVTGYTMVSVDASDFETAVSNANSGNSKSSFADTDGTGLKYYGTTVVFLSKTSLRHYFTIKNQDTYDTNVNNYPANAAFTIRTDKLPYVYFEMQDIPAAKLDTLQTFTFGGQTYSFSVLDYARALIGDGCTEAEQNMGKATYWYNHYANIYFNQ